MLFKPAAYYNKNQQPQSTIIYLNVTKFFLRTVNIELTHSSCASDNKTFTTTHGTKRIYSHAGAFTFRSKPTEGN